MPPQTAAIPLDTTILLCGRCTRDLTCRRYAADDMTTHGAFGHDPATPYSLEKDSGVSTLGDISTSGQVSNATTRRLAIRNIEADIGKRHADTFLLSA